MMHTQFEKQNCRYINNTTNHSPREKILIGHVKAYGITLDLISITVKKLVNWTLLPCHQQSTLSRSISLALDTNACTQYEWYHH